MNRKNSNTIFSFRNRKTVLTGSICLSIIAIIVILDPSVGSQNLQQKSNSEQVVRKVSVKQVIPEQYMAKIELLGQALPKWNTSLRSEIDGKILWISDNFRTGGEVKKGELLVKTEATTYLSAVAEAKVRVSNAELSLLKEQGEAKEAEMSWKESGLNSTIPSPLVLRKPQLKLAQEELKAARRALQKAEKDLEYTHIEAPYRGVITERKVSPGDSLFIGGEIGTMFSSQTFQIVLYLKESQLKLIPDKPGKIEVKLHSTDTYGEWTGKVVEQGNYLETDSRLVPLLVQIENPLSQNPPLIAGKFLKAVVTGKPIKNLLCIQESSVTGTGHIWYIDTNGSLEKYKPKPLFREGTKLYIPPPPETKTVVQIASNPDSTYIRGTKVEALKEN